MIANVVGIEKVLLIMALAAVPLLVGFLVGRWGVLLLGIVVPFALGVAAEGVRWEIVLMSFYVPPSLLLLTAGVAVAKLRRKRQRPRSSERAGQLREDRQVGMEPDPLDPSHPERQ